jgi:energy-coupling factor transporter ATP-binding protein EcfA2
VIFDSYSFSSFLDYLDRESLAALIEALKVFEGGVLVITHNRDFSESLCKEVWAMRDGRLEASGHNWVEGQGAGPRIDKAAGEEEDQYDAMGNKIDSKKAKKSTILLCPPVCSSLTYHDRFRPVLLSPVMCPVLLYRRNHYFMAIYFFSLCIRRCERTRRSKYGPLEKA